MEDELHQQLNANELAGNGRRGVQSMEQIVLRLNQSPRSDLRREPGTRQSLSGAGGGGVTLSSVPTRRTIWAPGWAEDGCTKYLSRGTPPRAGMRGPGRLGASPDLLHSSWLFFFFAIPSRIIRSIVSVICRGLHCSAAAVNYRGFPSFP